MGLSVRLTGKFVIKKIYYDVYPVKKPYHPQNKPCNKFPEQP
jgi:hypothetical protein